MDNFTELARKIQQEVQSLEELEQEIEGAEGNEGEDVCAWEEMNAGSAQPSEPKEACPGQPTRRQVVHSRSRTADEAFAGDVKEGELTVPSTNEAGSRVVRWWDQAEQKELDAGICSFIQARKRQQCKKKAMRVKFSLSLVAQQLEQFVENASHDRLELPPYQKGQRRKITAVAALYKLEARSCGRAGQTYFRTKSTAPLDPEGKKQLERYLLCGTSHAPTDGELQLGEQVEQSLYQSQKAASRRADESARQRRKKRRKASKQAEGHTADTAANNAALSVPLSADNMGSKMLALMGWSAGQGLGAQGQGIAEPVQVVKRRKRQGLGAD